MLKKLVKYGNSNALVLDKALLELLNISEGSVVKIKTDGTSLIITPQKSEVEQNILTPTITPEDTLRQALKQAQQNMAQHYNNPEEYMSEARKLFARYDGTIKKFNSPEYKEAVLEIGRRFKGNSLDPEYGKALEKLGYEYAPELVQMDQEMQVLTKKYATQELKKSPQSDSAFSSSIVKFKHVHEKYRHVQEQVMKLSENSDYINESVLLAEKYQVTKNSPEYIQEYKQLIAKYIPEYAQYQEEITAVGDSLK